MKWTLVTGGAKRIGAGICSALAARGHNIIVHYCASHDAAKEVAVKCRNVQVYAETLYGDFSTLESTQTFISELHKSFPNVSHLINNVGNYFVGSALETSPNEWEQLFQINLHAPFALIKATIPTIKQAQGCIINLGVSALNSQRAILHSSCYHTTKQALLSLTKSLAKELAPFQVSVNMVSPGQMEISIDKPHDLAAVPMHRLGTIEEVVRVVIFLMEKENQYITGQNVEVAGGFGL